MTATAIRRRVRDELPDVHDRLHHWKTAITEDGRPAVEAKVNRARWPEGPTRLRFFEHRGDLVGESIQGGRAKVVICDSREPGVFYESPLYPLGNPAQN